MESFSKFTKCFYPIKYSSFIHIYWHSALIIIIVIIKNIFPAVRKLFAAHKGRKLWVLFMVRQEAVSRRVFSWLQSSPPLDATLQKVIVVAKTINFKKWFNWWWHLEIRQTFKASFENLYKSLCPAVVAACSVWLGFFSETNWSSARRGASAPAQWKLWNMNSADSLMMMLMMNVLLSPEAAQHHCCFHPRTHWGEAHTLTHTHRLFCYMS